MGPVWAWVIQTVGLWPPIPVPFALAALMIVLVIIPLARKALKSSGAAEHSPTLEQVDLRLPWGVTTQLVMIDRNTQDILHELRTSEGRSRLDLMEANVQTMSERVDDLNKLLRQRSGRSKKLTGG